MEQERREITRHHDGHGLAEKLRIEADPLDPNSGMASHRYRVYYDTGTGPGTIVAEIQFQQGPRDVEGSTAGILDQCLLAIVLDRMECFNKGPYPSRQNALVITKLEEALHWMRDRADERARRGVLGKNQK